MERMMFEGVRRKTAYSLTITILLTTILITTVKIQPVKGWTGTVTIRADGRIDPPDAPILSFDNMTYTMTDDIYGSISVERGNIIVHGNDHTLQGEGTTSGLDLYIGVNNVTIKKTNISGFLYGIIMWESHNNTVTDNSIINNTFGIMIILSNNTSLNGNTISNNERGIVSWWNSNNTILTDNIIFNNNGTGVDISDSFGNIVCSNIISNNNGTGVGIWNSFDSIINNNTINNNINGIWLKSSFNNLITDNNVSKNQGYGIFVNGTSSATISSNTIANNTYGIYLNYSNYNTITHNHVENNTESGIYLNYVYYGNVISYNYVANNTKGISLFMSLQNIIKSNNITTNMYGIEMLGPWSKYNKIFHNNFINNKNQTYSQGQGTNTWDDGYPSGGNYWSDYLGEDQQKGPNQNIIGSDGIGDAPYIIDYLNKDCYPLMPPYPEHDIGIISIKKSKSIVGEGYLLKINIEIVNYGNNVENFSLKLYSNETQFGNENITLPNRWMDTFVFAWNTSGFVKGNYTISAYAWPVPGETDTADNTLIGGWVYVGIPGDVDANNLVNMLDLYYIALTYGTTPPNPNYNPNHDIDNNNIINMLDLYIAALHYGQTDP